MCYRYVLSLCIDVSLTYNDTTSHYTDTKKFKLLQLQTFDRCDALILGHNRLNNNYYYYPFYRRRCVNE